MWHHTVGLMVLLTLGVLGMPLAAAQQPTKTMPRIGFLTRARLPRMRPGSRPSGRVCASWGTWKGTVSASSTAMARGRRSDILPS